jgi:hypothetical protein
MAKTGSSSRRLIVKPAPVEPWPGDPVLLPDRKKPVDVASKRPEEVEILFEPVDISFENQRDTSCPHEVLRFQFFWEPSDDAGSSIDDAA